MLRHSAFTISRCSRLAVLALLLHTTLSFAQPTPPAAQTRDLTFFVLSDPHLGADHPTAKPPVTAEQTLQQAQLNLDRMRALVGQPFPRQGPLASLDLGAIPTPKALFILGDLTDGHKDLAQRRQQWTAFEDLYPLRVPFGQTPIPVFASLGNHDGEAAGPQGQGLIRRNRALHAAGHLAALSDNGLHYALNWQGVHLICLNLCPADSVDDDLLFRYGKPGRNSWNDPQGALTFLKTYLQTHVGASGQPILLLQHYGFDTFSLNDWNWWTPKQRRAMHDVIKDYNIVAILHGHNHHAEHYLWPDPKRHAADIAACFPNTPPQSLRPFDIISCGQTCWVFRIKSDQLIAAHYKGARWSPGASAYLLKSLAPQRRP